jgi:hypothetical protein
VLRDESLFIGQDVRPAGYDPLAETLTFEQVQKSLDDIRAVVAKCAATMPAHQSVAVPGDPNT